MWTAHGKLTKKTGHINGLTISCEVNPAHLPVVTILEPQTEVELVVCQHNKVLMSPSAMNHKPSFIMPAMTLSAVAPLVQLALL